jgi:hypothetical protein
LGNLEFEVNNKGEKVENCPFCGGAVEIGCLMGNMKELIGPFQWFEGEPTVWKNVFPLAGESLGDFEFFKGPFMKGSRCIKCRKLFLNY